MSIKYPKYLGLDEDNRYGDPTLERWEISDGVIMYGVHSRHGCEKSGMACVLHNPSDHHMREWLLHWRSDRGIFERICEHGIGHPDPDQFEYMRSVGNPDDGIHGCDGCCSFGGVERIRKAEEDSLASAEKAAAEYRINYLLRRLNRAFEMNFKVTLDEWEVGAVAEILESR